jgi:tRNA G18 (ribose-2'-O)-methylase SpoU
MFRTILSDKAGSGPNAVRGYFGIGVERLSKPMNAGSLFRSAHAFGASFIFTVAAEYSVREARSDTSKSPDQLPWHDFASAADLRLPKGCRLVGVEFVEGAAALPTFRHPPQAAYILGPERGSLSPEVMARCEHLVRIPTAFCLNVGVAGAIVMYDRLLTIGRFGERPISMRTAPMPPPAHVAGAPKRRRQAAEA